MEAQPQLVGITLTNVQPENIATQNGRQVSRLYYNLTVPSNIQVTANEEQTFQQTLLRSPAAQFLFVERGTTALPVLLLVPAVPTPFTVEDSVVIAATSHGQRDRLLEQVRRAWEASLGKIPLSHIVEYSLRFIVVRYLQHPTPATFNNVYRTTWVTVLRRRQKAFLSVHCPTKLAVSTTTVRWTITPLKRASVST